MKTLEIIVIEAPAGVTPVLERIAFEGIDGEQVLTIGRDADSHLCLPDPHRFVSNHHARILKEGEAFFIEDLSTNGIFLNASAEGVGRVPVMLSDGDVIEIGEYRLRVDIFVEQASVEQASIVTAPQLEEPNDVKKPMLVEQEEVERSQIQQNNNINDHMSVLPKLLGLSSQNWSAERLQAFEQLIVVLLREALSGIQKLVVERSKTRNMLSPDATHLQVEANNPFKFVPNVDQLLKVLLGEGEAGYMTPVASVRTALKELLEHQQQLQLGAEKSLTTLLEQLDPINIEKKVEDQEFDTPQARHAYLWQTYHANFEQMITLFGGKDELIMHLLAEGRRQ